MADVVIVTDRPEDLWGLKNGLETGGHRVVLATTGPGPSDADPGVVIVDAVKDLTRGRDNCRSVRAASPRAPLLALVAAETLDAVGPDWEIDSFLLDPVAIPEALARIRIALGSQVMESAGTVRVHSRNAAKGSFGEILASEMIRTIAFLRSPPSTTKTASNTSRSVA